MHGTVASEIERRLPLLIEQHAGLLPDVAAGQRCDRAPVHLERSCLALAAWQSLDSAAVGWGLGDNTAVRAQVVGAGFGVSLDEDGTVSSVASAGMSERVIEAAGRFGSRFTANQERFTATMISNFQQVANLNAI